MIWSTRVDDPSQTAEARRAARTLAAHAGFDAAAAEKVLIVVSEAGSNIIKHAGGGQLVIRVLKTGEIEVLALDKGPGISDMEACLRDGFSTKGSFGTGLGAISRLSQFCDVYSRPGQGTALLARVTPSPNGHHAEPHDRGVVQVAKPGEETCGDQWGVETCGEAETVVLADGLGHGPDAARAANTAVETLEREPDLAPGELIEAMHLALRATRGAAVAAARLDRGRGIVTYAGLGNISGKISAPGERERHMVSINGTAGLECRKIQEFTYPWPQGALVILHSDGIATHWSLDEYPGLAMRDAELTAGVVYRDHCRRNDDATIVVSR